MGRLKNTASYLIGPMDLAPDGGEGWRKELTPFLESLGVTVFDPCNKPIKGDYLSEEEARAEINSLKRDGKFDEIRRKFKYIRNGDLWLVDHSTFVIANLNLDIYSCGSFEEIFLANKLHRPVIVRVEQGKAAAPNWLFFALPHQLIFSTWDEVKDYLDYVNDSPNSEFDDLNQRWIFLKDKNALH